MHLTLKKETTKPAAFNFLQQQERFDDFIEVYNNERPHQGIDGAMGRRKINLSQVFAGQTVGIREVENDIWLVSFLDYDLGFFDKVEGRVEPAPNPFTPEKVLTMSPV